MDKGKSKKRKNTHFRQTEKSFKALRQTSVFSHIKRNIPYNISNTSKRIYENQVSKLKKIKYLKKYSS